MLVERMAAFVRYVISISGILGVIHIGGIYIVERGQITLNCSSPSEVVWQRRTIGEPDYEEVFIHGIVLKVFSDRFEVSSSNSSSYGLIIKNISLSDAGSYKCIWGRGLSDDVEEFELDVLSTISCSISSKENAIGLNSCGIHPSIVNYTCSITHNGFKPPEFTWIDMSTGNVTSHPTQTLSYGWNISSLLSIKAELILPAFRCSVGELMTCTTTKVPVLYAIKSNHHLVFHAPLSSEERLTCQANSSVPCSYSWKTDKNVISTSHLLSVRDLRASGMTGETGVNVTCEAFCQLLIHRCQIEVMSVEADLTSHGANNVNIDIVIAGVSVFLLVGIFLLGFIAFIKRKSLLEKLSCFRKPEVLEDAEDVAPLRETCFTPFDHIDVEETLLPLYLINQIKQYGDRAAFIDPNSGKSFQYSQLGDLIERVARGLYFNHGVHIETRIAVVSPNCIHYPVIYHAILRIGAICIPLSYRSSPEELKSCLMDSRISMVITTSECLEKCHRINGFASFKILVIGQKPLESYFSLEDPCGDDDDGKGGVPDIPRPLEADAVVSYSSGTTGGCKGCVHTHRSYLANLKQMSHPAVEMFRPGQEVSIAVVSMSHMYGQDLYFLAGMASGCTMVVMEEFTVRRYLQLASTYQITCAHLVPSHLIELLESDLFSEHDLSHLYKVETKAAHLPLKVASLFKEKLPNCRLLKGYGMTEAMCISKEVMKDEESDSVGRLLPGVNVVVLGVKSDLILGPNQEGKLFVDSPALFKGYFDRNLSAAYHSGFFRTNDLGYVDSSGKLHVTGRLDDLIKCGEELVSPIEIEEIIARHKKVADVGVVGTFSTKWGQAPMAFVVRGAKDLSEDEIHNLVSSQVAPHKKLQEVRFIDSIPRLASGKIQRTKLRQMASKGNSLTRIPV